jgi:uncharacterized protein YggE
MKKKILLIFLLLTAALSAQTINKSFIIIDASSKVETPANEIILSVSLEKTDTDAMKAYDGVKQQEKKFVPLLSRLNIPDSVISYSLIQVHPAGGYNGRPVQYTAREMVMFKLKDFKQYEPLQMAILTAGIISFNATFSASDVEEAMKKGFEEALENAKHDALIISDKLGRKLGRVLEVDSGNKNYLLDSPMRVLYSTGAERKLTDIPQMVTLTTKLKVKFELK